MIRGDDYDAIFKSTSWIGLRIAIYVIVAVVFTLGFVLGVLVAP